MKIMHNLYELINKRVYVYVIIFPTYDLMVQDTGTFVTLFQRILVFHIPYP